MNHEAVFALYPNAVSSDDSGLVLDAQGKRIEVDQVAYKALSEQLKAAKDAVAYKAKRAAAYPPAADYLDAIVKGDQAQIDKYIADCLAVKAQFPKPNK